MRRMTATHVEINSNHTVDDLGRITCECTGEMEDGTKVWTDVETAEQYFLVRVAGKFYFYHV